MCLRCTDTIKGTVSRGKYLNCMEQYRKIGEFKIVDCSIFLDIIFCHQPIKFHFNDQFLNNQIFRKKRVKNFGLNERKKCQVSI